jgi:DNA replication protein DnaC
MLNQATLDKMNTMKLAGMVEAFRHQQRSSDFTKLSFEERLGFLVDAEWGAREERKLTRRLRVARLRYPAAIEDIDYQTPRGLDRQLVLALGTCQWIREHQALLLTGSTGVGKSFLACAFVHRACRAGFSARYVRLPRLLHELAVAHGDGTYTRALQRLARLDLLAIDDWLLTPLKDPDRRHLLEIIEDRYEQSATLITTQLPLKSWHEAIGEASLADAICDRLVHRAHLIALKGPSMRQIRAGKKPREATPTKERKDR